MTGVSSVKQSTRTDSVKAESSGRRWRLRLFAVSIVCLGGLVRWLGSRDQFWLDEIWSWRFALDAKSYWQIATGLPHDNNQILNTWIIYSLPRNIHWSVYRIPAMIAGMGTVILAGLCGFRRSRAEGIMALILTASSFVFIQYSSEARGYAYLLFFTFLCLWFMDRITTAPSARDERLFHARGTGASSVVWAATPSAWDELLFSVSATLGFLSHFLFACAFAGFGVWSLIYFFQRLRRWSDRLRAITRMFALPILIVGGLAVSYRAQLMTGGGDRHQLLAVILESASLSFGGPNQGGQAYGCAAAAILALIAGIVLMARERDGRYIFVITSIATLALMIVVSQSETVYVRHLLIPVASILIVGSHVLARLWSVGFWGRIACSAICLLIVAGNSVHTWGLLEYGRGGYGPALAYIQAESKQPDLSIGSDHDFRNGMVLSYYYLWLKNPKPLHYHRLGQWPPDGPEWIIRHEIVPEQEPMQTIFDGNRNRYQLVAVYPHSGLSGWTWLIYHRVSKDPA